jgi:hypothetical protein
MKVAICQPAYLPWAGYFDLMDQVDVFVLLDDVQFEKQSWQQRNRIKSPTGLQWLTVPVMFRGRFGQPIMDVEIRDAEFWRNHTRAIELNYGRARCFRAYSEELRSHLECAPGARLADLNIRVIDYLMRKLGIQTRLVRSSELQQPGKRTERLANICSSLGATTYLSPLGSADYLLAEKDILLSSGIEVLFHNYQHPEYQQLFPPFVPYASAIDLLLNEGKDSLEIIRRGRRAPLAPEELVAEAGMEAS